MSSNVTTETSWVVWLILASSLGLFVWYSSNQLLYSLYFLYQLLRALFPAYLPEF